MANTQEQHQSTDKYTYNTSLCKIGIIENSRYHPFNHDNVKIKFAKMDRIIF